MSIQTISIQQFFNNPYTYTTSLPTSSIVAANADPLSMFDVRRIFDGKRVVFAGDPPIRSIYKDMATFLVKGHRLCSSQVAVQNVNKLTPEINERRVRAGGRPGMADYVDERLCQWSSSSSLHYLYLHSLYCQESNELVRLVQDADLFIFSSVKGDMNQMIAESPIPFSEHLDVYASNMFSLCQRLVVAATSSSSSSNASNPLLLWLTPLISRNTLSQEQKNQFLQIVAVGENSAKTAGFRLFDQLNVFLADGGRFTDPRRSYFSSIGIRLISTLLTEIAADHWQRPIRLPLCSSPLSPVPLVVDTSTYINRSLDDSCTQL